MIISVTERQSYMRCHQMWDWSSFNRNAYQPIIAKPALAVGKLWHQVQAEWSLHPEQNPNELALTLADAELDRVQLAYHDLVGAPMSPLELEPVYDQMGLVLSMVRNYHSRWGTPLPDGFDMVAPEQTCLIPIPGTPHFLEATLDGLIKDRYARVYVLERKTYGQRPKVEVLNMQDQFLAYLWVLRALDLGDIGGLAYDGAWKRKEPPARATLEDLFVRVILGRNRAELDNFERQLVLLANEMADNPAIYMNRRWDGCWDCSFVDPCISKLRGEDYEFLLRTKYMFRPRTEDTTAELKYAEVE